MRLEDLTKMLDDHGIGNSTLAGQVVAEHWYTTREPDNTVQAHCELVNVTDYTHAELLRWLGY